MTGWVNEAYEALQPYVPGKPVAQTKRELKLASVIKLASNENPYGPSPKAMAAIEQALSALHDYPDADGFDLKTKLASKLGVGYEQIILGNGSNEIIESLARVLLRPDEAMLFANPSFVAYRLAAQAMGRRVIDIPLTPDHRYDLEALLQAVTPKTKLLFIANPNNPTGTYIAQAALRDFLQRLPEHVVAVLDEAYFEYATAADYPNGIELLPLRKRLMVLRTFSKAYGLAGARVGYGVGHADLVGYLHRAKMPFNVGSLSQVGATAALDDTDFLLHSKQANAREMQRLVPQLAARGLTVVPSQANFVLVDFHKPASDVFAALLRQGVTVRPMDGYGMATWQRITIGTAEQNDRLLAVIDAIGL